MFNGFTDETFEFFMAIRFNNNRDFFQGNRDWYLRAVREPCLQLADALAPTVEAMDEDLERRPHRVVSRINRDIRFSNDKSPYRDYLWLAFRRPGEERKTTLGVYFDISVEGASYGMGFYTGNMPLLNGLRRQLRQAPMPMLGLWRGVRDEFQLFGNTIKRMKVPEEIPEELRAWYPLRGFYLQKELEDFSLLKSPALADEIIGGFKRLTPLYQYIRGIPPQEENEDA